jgi:hypothetical protein
MPMPRRPHVASPDEIRITRDGDAAIIEYADSNVATTNFVIGKKKLDKMTDAQILRMWNRHIRTRDEFMAEYEHVCVEVPLGKPQVRYEERADQWVPRGDVLRTQVLGAMGDQDLDEEFITIDNRDFTIREFVRMVSTFGGWGMRIAFVPDDELHEEPEIVVKEPEEGKR